MQCHSWVSTVGSGWPWLTLHRAARTLGTWLVQGCVQQVITPVDRKEAEPEEGGGCQQSPVELILRGVSRLALLAPSCLLGGDGEDRALT